MRSTNDLPTWDDGWILLRRPARTEHDPWKPHGVLVEKERTRWGSVEDVATVFLTNRECPFRCLMCDLWKYTTRERVPDGAVASQVEQALQQVAGVAHVKLYNAGNFFDAQAIPTGDLPRIAELVGAFRTVLVECHPRLVSRRVLDFRDRLRGHPLSPRPLYSGGEGLVVRGAAVGTKSPSPPAPLPTGERGGRGGELQVAMGLETVHPDVLPRLNKRMTLDDFARATRFLVEHDIPVRAFLLLRPPLLDEAEGLEWAKRSLDWAFAHGVECCTIIPTRAGNGAMEELQRQGLFHPPSLASLEEALAYGLALGKGRVFADLWDVRGDPATLARLERMNHEGRA